MITISLPNVPTERKELPFFGISPSGDRLDVTNRCIRLNGSPIFPITGEFHYARYRAEDWKRELCKIKAGGITIVATYVFWIHHEETEGEWDFSGDRDLRRFVELCGEVGLQVLLRIGPWCHGECRNGGSPDWIALQDVFPIRTDNETYLGYVSRWFSKIGEQVRGLFWEDGGPIVGVQLENEYRAYAEPDHAVRRSYMHKLKEIAQSCGFHVPLWTATAWGTATLNEMETLPVLGGYADAAWANHTDEMPESEHFLFRPPLNDPNIGSDLKQDDQANDFDVDISAYPYLTAELGGGMQVTFLRRVLIDAKDTEAMSVCMIGSGAALLGYYMYHGGTNPVGRFSTMEENKPYKLSNVYPIRSYDFQACIRENGDLHESYHRTRRHHLFLQTFPWLSDTETFVPKDSAKSPSDLTSLRYCVRYDPASGSGFLFLNGHCRRRTLADHPNLDVRIRFGNETIELPRVDLKNGEVKYLPFRLQLGDALLESSNATPLCRLGDRWFFYTDEEPIYRFRGNRAEIVTLTEQQARYAYLLQDRLWIAACSLYETEDGICAEYYEDTEILRFGKTGEAETVRLIADPQQTDCRIRFMGDDVWEITLPNVDSDADADRMLDVSYLGDRIEFFDRPRATIPIADWYTNGLPCRLSMKALGDLSVLYAKVYPFDGARYFDVPPEQGCELLKATLRIRTRKLLQNGSLFFLAVNCGGTDGAFNAEQTVVFCHALTAARGARFDIDGTDADRNVGECGVLGFSRTV